MPYGTYGNHTGYDLYAWDEPTKCWKYRLDTTSTRNWSTAHPGANFVPGRGYLYSVQATNPTKTFTGNLNNGTISYNLTMTTDTNRLKGFNLVGNPYPSSIDWAASSGWTRTFLTPGGVDGYNMWIWNPDGGNYGVYNSADGGGTGTNSVTRYIAPMQGFFVLAGSSGSLGFTNAVRVDATSSWKSAPLNPDRISVVVKSEHDQTFDEVRLLFGYPEGQTGAAKLFSPVTTAPSLYLSAGHSNYTVRYLSDTITYPKVPVHFKPGVDGAYMLNVTFEPTTFKTVLLEDKQLSRIQDLKIEPSYRFNASRADPVNRFVLHFTPFTVQTNHELPAKIYTDGTHIVLDLTQVTGNTRVSICDLLGRKLYESQVMGETQHTLNFTIGTQLLIIQLQNSTGQFVRKILCNNTFH